MGTVKRERQKANRQQRLQELAKEARRNKSKRVGLRIFLVIAVVVGVVAVISFLGGDDDNPTAASTTVAGAEVPQVSVPEEEPTELKVTTINEGTGEAAKAGDSLEVFYVGARWEDGQQFQENYSSGSPIPVVLGTGGVIAGWDEGLVGVKAGGRY
ncbi:MAG TPA: FKBP-type peptidyl-prolyl cis-trans isomerase, partial [Ilumatobacteraceae bacterium]|nr:FKBP-type peptidyl-prolyl cis-trans isomerase [Ilumatobacteraceae bacterium]